MCRRPVSVYQLSDIATNKKLATPKIATIYGSVFVQNLGMDVASYHFDSEDNCYISYAKAPASWKDDSGEEVPPRKHFKNCLWDEEKRIFRGSVEWDPPMNDSRMWTYELTFAEDFVAIVGGSVEHGHRRTSFKPPWSDTIDGNCLTYFRATPTPNTIFGGVYVQGMDYRARLEGVASYHFESEDNCYISYANARAYWRLDDGRSPPPTKQFVDCSYDPKTLTFTGVITWDVPFQRAVRWEYELVFSKDFARITRGVMQSFTANDDPLPEYRYVDPLLRDRSPWEMVYVRKPGALMEAPAVCASACSA